MVLLGAVSDRVSNTLPKTDTNCLRVRAHGRGQAPWCGVVVVGGMSGELRERRRHLSALLASCQCLGHVFTAGRGDGTKKKDPELHEFILEDRFSQQVPLGREYAGSLTLISLMDASVSMEMEVSPLPLREEVPPREASVAADRPGRPRDPCKSARTECDFGGTKLTCGSTTLVPLLEFSFQSENCQRLTESSKERSTLRGTHGRWGIHLD